MPESREWLRVTLSSIGDAVITTDASGSVTFLNPVAETLTGWTSDQAAGVALPLVFRIVNQQTRKEVENPALRALREGVIVGLANHTVLIARDGVERPIDDSAAPIRNDKGEVAGAVLVFRDITERLRAQAAMAHLAAIVTSSDDAIISKDLRGIIQTWNMGAQRLFGYTAEETVGKPIMMLIPTDRHNEETEILERIGRGESIDHYETVRHRKDGTLLDISLTVSPMRDAAGRIIGASKVARDITGRKLAEQALHDSEVRYRRLFQTAKDGILILDADTGKIIDSNGYMSALVGLEAHELLGKQLFEIGMFGDESENRAAFRELQEKHYIRYEHLPVRNQRGEKVEVEVIANVYHEDHTLVAQCNVRDISQRVAMEKKITAQAEQLAGESQRKDEFLAMLSHELRNPLAPIRSAVQLLRIQERGSENIIQKQAHDIIERQVASLTRLVSDLMEVSRVVTGRIRLTLQTVDMNLVLQHAIETAKPLIEQRKQALTISLGDEPIWVNADPTRMEEVFINLLNNSAKYTPDGGQIEVHCETPRGHNYAQVRVRDTGVGIEKELLPRIFDLFTQADRSLAHSAGGLGIGLSLAHRIVDLHGGHILATSPPDDSDQGTEMTVRLARTHAPTALVQPSSADGETRPADSHGMRVLVIDDNIDLVMMLASSLRNAGYSVQSAYTGPDGLKVAQTWRPDIVLLDIGLPGLDGYEVARRLRADPSLKAVRLIALTGYGRDADLALAREAGFDAHLVKPYEFEELKNLMASTREEHPTAQWSPQSS